MELCTKVNRVHKKFPLIQLPRKSEAFIGTGSCFVNPIVSINSTSEEVRSGYVA